MTAGFFRFLTRSPLLGSSLCHPFCSRDPRRGVRIPWDKFSTCLPLPDKFPTCPTVGIPSPVLGKRAMRRLTQIVFLGICAFLGGVAANVSPRLGASAAAPLSVPG